ncbi:uncharacterized protein [Dermacentor albipictus]|uniref:uncharacterized protein isoform X2 n=1 Tax=Dermacentor albipictus TaxID=60249 RepID=UPI0031FD3E62
MPADADAPAGGVNSFSKPLCPLCHFCPLTLLVNSLQVWDEHQETLLTEFSDTSLQLCGDGRCDSPGHSAKFLSYFFLCPEKRKIIHTEQVQVKESEQVQASAQMEKGGLVRGLKFFCEQGTSVSSLSTDRHSGIKQHMRLQCPEINHHFNVWHVAKGIRKKLAAASRRAGCSAITKWTQAITNHLYWCACSCGDNGDMLVAPWSSMLNHIKNIHEGHGGLYPRCLHRGSCRRMHGSLLEDVEDGQPLPASTTGWRLVSASSGKITCKVTHPADPSRNHFCSDFPHLVKCVRNSFVSTGFTTPDGRACAEHIEGAWDKDKSSLTLKAMPHITKAHVRPKSFEKIKVSLAFTLGQK